MSKLISILMPTRGNIGGLMLALGSIKRTATNMDEVEILLRMDDDDPNRTAIADGLAADFGARTIVGPRGRGYIDMGVFINDLAKEATGQWCWLMDDDAWIEGNWQPQIAAIPADPANGPCLNAEFYQLGPSHYVTPQDSPVGLIMPTALVKKISHNNPVDAQWWSISRQMGWTTHFLKGVTYYHEGRAR